MDQTKIWDYFQNECRDDAFPEARQRFLLRHLRSGAVCLNIGIGSGALERLAGAAGVDMHSLDPSERAIERLRQEGMGDKARAGFSQSIPFDSAKFDVVVMSEVLEHLDDPTLDATLDEVRRVLKSGGVFLATTPFREDLRTGTVVCPGCSNVFHRMGHVQSIDRVRMRHLLEGHGYRIEQLRVTTFVDWQRKGIKNLAKSALRVLLARLGEPIADPHLVAIARTPR